VNSLRGELLEEVALEKIWTIVEALKLGEVDKLGNSGSSRCVRSGGRVILTGIEVGKRKVIGTVSWL
jgi:hypothetical protein